MGANPRELGVGGHGPAARLGVPRRIPEEAALSRQERA